MGNNVNTSQMTPEVHDVAGMLSKISMFRGESPKNIASVAHVLSKVVFREGDQVIRQGDPADSLYIIIEGAVLFYTEKRDDDTLADLDNGIPLPVIELGTLGAGSTFGEFGLIHSIRRTCHARAVTPRVIALQLSKSDFEKYRKTKYMKPLTARVNEVSYSMVKDGLLSVSFLEGLKESQLRSISKLFKFQVIDKHEVIVREGDPGSRFYVVYHGELVVTMTNELGLDVEICRLGPGDKFGENSLVDGSPRTATITTLSKCEVFYITRQDWEKFTSLVPEIELELRRGVDTLSHAGIINKNVDIFRGLSLPSQQRLGVASYTKVYAPGETVLREGDKKSQAVYVILNGAVDVIKDGKVVRKLSSMKTPYFGEVSIFKDAPNSATLKVTQDSSLHVLVIPKEAFQVLVDTERSVFAEIAIRVFGRHELSLDWILLHDRARDIFLRFCEKEWASENVEFWREVYSLESLKRNRILKSVLTAMGKDWRKVQKGKREELKKRCMYIFETFVKPGAKSEVNISGPARMSIVNKVEKEEFEYDMFSEARDEVFRLVEADNFNRFKASPEFETLLTTLSVYVE